MLLIIERACMIFTAKNGILFTKKQNTPYQRKDGSLTSLAVWEAVCAKPDCSALFTITTPADAGIESKAFGRKHCDNHKATRAECTARAALVNRKLTDTDVIEIRKLASEGLKPADLALVFPATAGTLREIIAGRSRK
jgi:hypothetical protein